MKKAMEMPANQRFSFVTVAGHLTSLELVADEPNGDMHVLVRTVGKARAKTPSGAKTRTLYSDRPPFAAQL
jgi:hypothetical protein